MTYKIIPQESQSFIVINKQQDITNFSWHPETIALSQANNLFLYCLSTCYGKRRREVIILFDRKEKLSISWS